MSDNIILKILTDYPDAWKNAKRFKALLLDYLPTDKVTRNLIGISIDELIPNDMLGSYEINKTQAFNYSKRIMNAVGCSSKDASRIVDMWIDYLNGKNNSELRIQLPKYSELTDEQATILNLPYAKRFLIKGVSKTGKTVLSIYRSFQAADVVNEKVILLEADNGSKKDVLEKAQGIDGFLNKVTVLTWSEWLDLLFNEHGMTIPKEDGYDWNSIISAVKLLKKKDEYIVVDSADNVPTELANILAVRAMGVMCFFEERDDSINHDNLNSWIRTLCIEAPYTLSCSYDNQTVISADLTKDDERKSVLVRPGGELLHRPLKFIFLRDVSEEMNELNCKEIADNMNLMLNDMREVDEDNINVYVIIKTLCITDNPYWENPLGEELNLYTWRKQDNKGNFNISDAFDMLGQELDISNMGMHSLPPTVVLLTNSRPSNDYLVSLEHLKKKPWFRKAIKVCVVSDKCDKEIYGFAEQFTGNRELILRIEDIKYISRMFWREPS